ncbi:MAG TPA: hypothetical protein VN684_08835 [Terriglobales bacterium]|nr:hypothetical protein [Terriglobales bacterium]
MKQTSNSSPERLAAGARPGLTRKWDRAPFTVRRLPFRVASKQIQPV